MGIKRGGFFAAAGLFLAGVLFSSAPAAAQAPNGLRILFTNSSGDLNLSNVFLNVVASGNAVGGGGSQVGFYNASTNVTWGASDVFSQTLSVDQVNAFGGYTVTNITSGNFYISYGTTFSDLTTIPGNTITPSTANENVPFQYFELTRLGNGNDQGDVTAINWFTAPLSISSYSSYTTFDSSTLIQHKGLAPGVTANQVAELLYQAMGGTSSTAFNTNNPAQPLRLFSPNSAGSGNPYPTSQTFTPYIEHLQNTYGTNSFATFSNETGTPTLGGSNNYSFTWTMNGTITNGNSIFLTGEVAVTNKIGNDFYAVTNFSGLTLELVGGSNASDMALLTQILMAAPGTSPGNTNSLTAFSANWSNYYNWLIDNSIITTNQPTENGNPYYGVQSQMIGEVAAGFVYGFVGSTNTDYAPGATNALGQLESSNWWKYPEAAFSQTNSAFYEQYVAAFALNSSNTIYSSPYSDRFTNVNNNPTLMGYNYIPGGTTDTNWVYTWVVDLSAPFTAVPEAGTALYLVIGFIGFAIAMSFRRKKEANKAK